MVRLKRWIALMLSVILMLGSLPLTAMAAENETTVERYAVLVLDVSDSMRGTPFDNQKIAAKKFCESMLNAEGNNQVAIITLGSNTLVRCAFSDDLDHVYQSINNISCNGGTNTSAALQKAKELLDGVETTGSSVVKNIVLCSDGLPESGTTSADGPYTSDDYGNYRYANACYNTAEEIKESTPYFIYTLGFFHSLSGNNLDFGRRFMNDLQNAGYYEVVDPYDLEFVFGSIAGDVLGKSNKFKYAGQINNNSDSVAEYYYSDNYFFKDPDVYNPSLSTMSLCLELSTWSSYEQDAWYDHTLTEDDAAFWKDKLVNAKTLLLGSPDEAAVKDGYGGIGFEHFAANEFWESVPTKDSVGVIAARKQIERDGEKATLVAVAVRGGGYGSEWASNLTVGASGDHDGFADARDKVLTFLKSYLGTMGAEESQNIKLWLVGYSRAAATANMVAGAINNRQGVASTLPAIQDVFCYTFEAPMGVLNVNAGGDHSNIHNVINLNDLVPYVAPYKWGFTRYNGDHDWVLPTAATSWTWRTDREKMLIQMEELGYTRSDYTVPETSTTGTLHIDMANIMPFGEPLWWVEDSEMDTRSVLTDGVDFLAEDVLKNRTYYTENLQPVVRDLLGIFLHYNGAGAGLSEAFWGSLSQLFAPENLVYILSPMFDLNPLVSTEARCAEVANRLGSKLGVVFSKFADIAGFIDAVGDCLEEVFVQVAIDALNSNTDSINTVANLVDVIAQGVFNAHYPEVTLAWVRSQDPNYTQGVSGSGSGVTRVVHINCPVDVTVKDAQGNVAAAIVDDKTQQDENAVIAYVNDNGEKIVYLPADGSYTLEIKATDNGKVSYSLNVLDCLTNTTSYQQNYYDIEVVAGDVIVASVPEISDNQAAVSYTLMKDDETINPDESFTDEAVPGEHTVTLDTAVNSEEALADKTIVGGYVDGAGKYQHGAYAQVEAKTLPGSSFYGWYNEDGDLVSSEAVYRFAVREDVKLTAKFDMVPYNQLQVTSTTGGTVADGSGVYTEGMKIQLSATPDPGYSFGGWTVSDGIIDDASNPETTFTMPAADVTITANFRKESSGSSSSGPTRYTVSVESNIVNGSIAVSPSLAKRGDTVTITVEAYEGYELNALTVRDSNGDEIALEKDTDTRYTFEMPAKRVTVGASFAEIEKPPVVLPFVDVSESDWFYDAVAYAYENDMMNGVSSNLFGPDGTTNRAMVTTILYRMAGSPDVSSENLGYPFADVDASSWYGDAVYWARLNGITNGTSSTNFGPDGAVTREQLAALLYRYADSTGYDVSSSDTLLNEYADSAEISSYAVTAMQWANENGLITGRTANTLAPKGTATRAELATILMRFCEELAA